MRISLNALLLSSLAIAAKAVTTVDLQVIWTDQGLDRQYCTPAQVEAFKAAAHTCVDNVVAADSNVQLSSTMEADDDDRRERNLRTGRELPPAQCQACDTGSPYYNPYMCTYYRTIGICDRRLREENDRKLASASETMDAMMLKADIMSSCYGFKVALDLPGISRGDLCFSEIAGVTTVVTVDVV